jgi:hypothetical protein
MPWRSVYETNERIQYKWSSTFIDLCLQYRCVFPVCADWLLLIDLWHPNWRAARNHHRNPCRLSFIQRACSQANSKCNSNLNPTRCFGIPIIILCCSKLYFLLYIIYLTCRDNKLFWPEKCLYWFLKLVKDFSLLRYIEVILSPKESNWLQKWSK